MSGFRKNMQRLSLLSILIVAVATLIVAPASAHAQVRRSTRRESNANRKARIERTTEETYSHRYELFGGGGYLRSRSGPPAGPRTTLTSPTLPHVAGIRRPRPARFGHGTGG